MAADPRRAIPSTDRLLALPEVQAASTRLAPHVIRRIITDVQNDARHGELAPDDVATIITTRLEATHPTRLSPVLNATGVIIHTNLGRAPLSKAAREALITAAGYVDLELDLRDGKRSKRGMWAKAALLSAVPEAEDALVVNNGAAALSLATTTLSVAQHLPEVVISRGELVEIGAGFRLPDLIVSAGVELAEVGMTNRTNINDYRSAITERTGAMLKVHPSNYWIGGFNASVEIKELAQLAREHNLPLIVDVGSGLVESDEVLTDEPTMSAALRDGADVVIASGDKLLGGPQAGILLGKTEIIEQLAKHPLARAFRADKFTLAALEATLNSPSTPIHDALHADSDTLRERSQSIASQLGVDVVAHDGRVGGGGGAGVPLPGWAIRLPESYAYPLRNGTPAILPRVADGQCLVDLRCVPADQDEALLTRLREAADEVAL
ncbi:L-seryl-tRNA(Sec) selenium transferase [Enteractinococcus coprophilus]|uniref:L-seryl-tRNA(Sec) selenium transferase n=1 Tax=Enteractinococcus coprophilus TaxID=1027633 RepID=A0A543AMF2_9MICC|nr:L-seryl-tRNA(Sec) selenium transferase [Enteractinococcus coprophilus]